MVYFIMGKNNCYKSIFNYLLFKKERMIRTVDKANIKILNVAAFFFFLDGYSFCERIHHMWI